MILNICCPGTVAVIVGVVLTVQSARVNVKPHPTLFPDISHKPTQPPKPSTGSPLGVYRYAAVAADSAVCSSIGSYVLAQGGSAVDGAIAALVCNGAVNMHSMGVGGGFFMVIHSAPNNGSHKEWNTLNAREMAPLAATEDMYVENPSQSTLGGKAIAVPGEIKGYWAAHEIYGRLEWRDLFQPTIDLCESGVSVTRALAGVIRAKESDIRNSTTLTELYVKADGTLTEEGDKIINVKLAETLRKISQDADSFYTGSLADDIVADITDAGGIITKADLNNYEVRWAPPTSVLLQNGGVVGEALAVHTMGIPSGGPVFASILNSLDGFNFSSKSVSNTKDEILTYHRIIEAFKFAFARRSELGDDLDLQGVVNNITSEFYANEIRQSIDDEKTYSENHYLPDFYFNEGIGTSHLSVVAPDGAAVSVTSTINLYFGSKVRGNRTGIIFNNEMDDFSTPNTSNAFGIPASSANFIKPGKRPQSSMSPSIITKGNDGETVLISGASGGPRIITANAWTVMNSLWFGKQLNKAIDEARIHHQLSPNTAEYESTLPHSILNGLKKKGHDSKVTSSVGIVQAIRVLCSDCMPGVNCPLAACLQASSDARKGGQPDGF